MRRLFFTGLAILLPVVLTVLIILLLINLMTRPFEGAMVSLFEWMGLLQYPLMQQFLAISTKVVVLIALIAVIFFVGILGRLLFLHYLIKWSDKLLHRIPIVNRIYKAAQDVVHTIFVSEKPNFSQVVLVPFPHEDCHSVGLVTNHPETGEGNLVSVFIPATPNPTMGFMLLFEAKQLHFLDIKVEDALRIIISCGAVLNQYSLTRKGLDSH